LDEAKGTRLSSKRRFYIVFVSRDPEGHLRKVPVPLHYAYIFVAAAAVGLFTVTGLAGSYSRMLIKTAHFNQLRQDHRALQQDYAHLEKQAHEKDVQAASLGSLATEVSALYGLTTTKLTSLRHPHASAGSLSSPLKDTPAAGMTDESYYKSVDAFYSLRDQAMNGDTTRLLGGPADLGRMANPLLPGHDLSLGDGPGLNPLDADAEVPTLWPVDGEISSAFGEREDPILGNGEGEFHPGIDIRGPLGTPIHATADGVVLSAGMVNGYGRFVTIDHGHGLVTGYGHMSGFAVTTGQSVVRGQVIGYVGHSGRATGNHVHYEVRIHGIAVNPHKYLRTTMAQFGATSGTPGF
jgi:murein DD-endopeptidase MepM/ murein hydrolase activator NlpD